jgi:hypothetical protein
MCNLMGHSIGYMIFHWWCFAETSPSIGKLRVKHNMGTLVTLKGTAIKSGGVKCRDRFVMHISGML